MFNIGFAELILLLLVAFLVVGPKDLPKVARWLGRCVKYIRRMIREVRDELGLDEIMEETQSVQKEIDSTLRESDLSADLKTASKELKKNLDEIKKESGVKKP